MHALHPIVPMPMLPRSKIFGWTWYKEMADQARLVLGPMMMLRMSHAIDQVDSIRIRAGAAVGTSGNPDCSVVCLVPSIAYAPYQIGSHSRHESCTKKKHQNTKVLDRIRTK